MTLHLRQQPPPGKGIKPVLPILPSSSTSSRSSTFRFILLKRPVQPFRPARVAISIDVSEGPSVNLPWADFAGLPAAGISLCAPRAACSAKVGRRCATRLGDPWGRSPGFPYKFCATGCRKQASSGIQLGGLVSHKALATATSHRDAQVLLLVLLIAGPRVEHGKTIFCYIWFVRPTSRLASRSNPAHRTSLPRVS